MVFQAFCKCLCRCRRGEPQAEPKPEEVPGTVTEDVVWNCAPEDAVVAEPVEPHMPPTLLEQVQAQLAALPPPPPKTFQNVVEHMVGVRDRLMKDVIAYADNATQLQISYTGAVNTLHWIFCPESDKTWDETIDGPAYDAIIEPLNEDYYRKHIFPAWKWRSQKI